MSYEGLQRVSTGFNGFQIISNGNCVFQYHTLNELRLFYVSKPRMISKFHVYELSKCPNLSSSPPRMLHLIVQCLKVLIVVSNQKQKLQQISFDLV